MPECPELHMASLFINKVCAGVVFTGAVEKSAVSKTAKVPFSSRAYRIKAVSRGKEVRLTLTPIKSGRNQAPMCVFFRFGMSGHFRFTEKSELPKHAHLRFYTKEKPPRALCFVDTRRFGSWQSNGSWQKNRGPCVITEYSSFRENVLSNLSDKAFNRPICEAILNQKYFNGIGNYLRAEIIYRSNIPPFVKARTVLEGLSNKRAKKAGGHGKKTKGPDLLSLCKTVPLEVVKLGRKGYSPEKGNYTVLLSWMQCYGVDGMRSLKDHNGRTMWFEGAAGPMAPKASKSTKVKRKIKTEDYTDAKKRKLVKKKPEKGKGQKGVLKKKNVKRPRNASKSGLRAADGRRASARRKSSSTGLLQPRAKRLRTAKAKSKTTRKPQKKRSRKT